MGESGGAGFPGTGRPDQGDGFARRDRERNILQDRIARLVTKGDVIKTDRAIDGRRVDGVGGVGDIDLDIDDLENALAGGHRPLHRTVLNGQRTDWVEETLGVK